MYRPLTRGSLLIEILVAVSVFAIIAAIGAQSLLVSLASARAAERKGAGAQLLTDMLQGVRSTSDENWQNLYGLTKSTTHYHPVIGGGKWSITSGDEIITLGTTVYERYFTVTDVSRDLSTRAIETSYTSAHDDPSTELVTAVVMASSTSPFTAAEYFFRWRNKTCNQTSWSGGAGSGVKTCPDTTYGSKSNVTAGADLKLCSGGC